MQVLILLVMLKRVLHRVSLLLFHVSPENRADLWSCGSLYPIPFLETMLYVSCVRPACLNFVLTAVDPILQLRTDHIADCLVQDLHEVAECPKSLRILVA